jgi:O-antigen ligase
MADLALTTDQITGVGIGTIAAIVVIGLVIALVVSKIVVKVIVALLVVALAVLVWTQRTAVTDAAKDAAKRCDATFFGIHIDPANDQVKQACEKISGS